jgi:predicted porin
MKKTLIALAALAATASFAQSTVTLSGNVDVGIINPIGAQKARVDQSANGANQIVFSGSEDLGGGLKANFRLAQRFSPESGLNDGSSANRPTFQGESTVGLSGGFGAVKVGRSLTAFQGPVNGTDPWGTLQQGSVAVLTTGYATDIDNIASSGAGAGRTDAVTYSTPAMNGFSASYSAGLKDSQSSGTVTTGAKNLSSLWVSYANGPLSVGAGTEQNRTGDKATALIATYNMGVATIGAGYGIVDTVAATADRKSYNVMATVPMGSVTLKAGYGQSKLDGAAASVKKTGIGADYALSKRTTLYTSYGRDAALATDKTGFDFGIRHSF